MLSLDSYHKVCGSKVQKACSIILKGHLEYSVKHLILESSRNMARKCHKCPLLADFKKQGVWIKVLRYKLTFQLRHSAHTLNRLSLQLCPFLQYIIFTFTIGAGMVMLSSIVYLASIINNNKTNLQIKTHYYNFRRYKLKTTQSAAPGSVG